MSFFSASDAMYGSGEYGAASYGVASGIVIVSGVSATASINAANASLSVVAESVVGTGQVGQVSFANDTVEALSSVSATASLGSVATLLNTYAVTVASDGYNNVYYIRGVAKPTLTFNRGSTYTFDLSDSSNTGHPLRFKDSLDNTFSGGVTVTGTPGTSGAQVQIVVDAATPGSLRYYCTVHGNAMGNSITVNHDNAYVAVYGTGEYGKAQYGVAFAIVQLDGTEATGSISPIQINGFEVDVGENLNSVSATGSIGTVSPNLAITVTGVEGTGLQNGVVIPAKELLVGVSVTGFINQVGIGNSVTLAGVQAVGSAHTLEEQVGEAVESVQATGSVGTLTSTGVVTVFDPENFSRTRAIRLVQEPTSRRAA